MSGTTLVLKIEAYITEDGGYYRSDTPEKIQELIQHQLDCMVVFIKRGATEPKPVLNAKITLHKIILEVG